ncbi:unnamed protein product [Gongylonema pulchrum]|uniref:SCP domain-containing protein n=1 Tax=Gongylonema pulchrum TaxID=637853 RepID=A0A3P6PR15_9BILA|nr:unnamed protein product [Gongylonema pulchrum]
MEREAQLWADDCKMIPSPLYERNGAGENVFIVYAPDHVEEKLNKAPAESIQSWWSEVSRNYKNNPKNKMTLQVMMNEVQHFLQMAWGKTDKIGCGMRKACGVTGASIFVVCRYSNPADKPNTLIYELGEPCNAGGGCSQGSCDSQDGLCQRKV